MGGACQAHKTFCCFRKKSQRSVLAFSLHKDEVVAVGILNVESRLVLCERHMQLPQLLRCGMQVGDIKEEIERRADWTCDEVNFLP
jgi:hypothetical protein